MHDLEHILHEGKLSFASEKRMDKYLGLKPGSVTPFGLINDENHEVIVFIDSTLQQADRLAFHPLDNRATVSILRTDLIRLLEHLGNRYEWKELY
jgi:Ala-tRNA(Pro) deacylase